MTRTVTRRPVFVVKSLCPPTMPVSSASSLTSSSRDLAVDFQNFNESRLVSAMFVQIHNSNSAFKERMHLMF